jgi:succinate dehydrogenase / fumarate reductase, iron-sulfur subunit
VDGEGTVAPGRTRRFRVFRYRRGDDAPRTDTFDVPVEASGTVLEGLRWIKVHADPGLAIRHSCFHASCGTCGVRVDGREGLACVTALDPSATSVSVEPMANFPVLADLVVDMGPFVERFIEPHPIVRPVGSDGEGARADDAGEHERFEDCIECGLCLSACPVAATDDTYVGPAALAYAQRMLERGEGDRDAILDWADDPTGAWRCHAAFECTEACPSGVRPAQRIMALRRELVRPRGER